MEYQGQGQHGHATNQANEYGNPVAAGHGATGVGGHGAAGEQVQPMRDDHKADGLLRRSGSSSSSSSSEDDGMGGRRKKVLKEKVKEKLPGGHKDSNKQDAAGGAYGQHGHAGATGTGAHGTEGTGEKNGLVDKIEKLPEQH